MLFKDSSMNWDAGPMLNVASGCEASQKGSLATGLISLDVTLHNPDPSFSSIKWGDHSFIPWGFERI